MKKITSIDEILDENRIPDTDDRHVGIEIEFACKFNENAVAEKILANESIKDYLSLHEDGSIEPDGDECNCCSCCGCSCDYDSENRHYGHEICVLVPEKDLTRVVTAVLKFIREDLGGYVNDSCGLHVHLDMRNRNPGKCYENLKAVQALLFRMNPIARLNGDFSQWVDWDNFETAKDFGAHYDAINATAYRKYQTIEVRMSAATLDTSRMLNWIKLLIRVTQARMLVGDIRTLRDLKQRISLTPSLKTFIQKRINANRKGHVKDSESPLRMIS